MNQQDQINRIRQSISKSRIAEALEWLEELITDPLQKNEVSQLQARFEDIRSMDRKGTVTPAEVRLEENKIISAVLELLTLFSSGNSATDRGNHDRTLMEELLNRLDSTFHIYQVQNRNRNYLMKKLRARFDIPRVENYYQVFSDYYDRMNIKEQRLHKIIRGNTIDIRDNHQACLDILRGNRHLKKLIPSLADLEVHLTIWLSKCKSIFMEDETMTLVYIGVEEGVKFPPKIRKELSDYLEGAK